jgi:putative CocE/NonD family hydrolase
MKPGGVYEFEIDLGSTSIIFNRGHRIRVAISSSNSPRYEPNPNTGEGWRASDRTQVAEQSIYVGGATASCIVLPVNQAGPQAGQASGRSRDRA